MNTANNPKTWARFLEERAPGLTWVASTLLEWVDLPPGARRDWTVMAQGSRSGELESLAAMHEASGLLAVASLPGARAPFLGTPDRVKRVVGAPAAVESLLAETPVLRLRRGPGVVREVLVFDGESPRRPPTAKRPRHDAWESLNMLRASAGGDDEPLMPCDLAGPIQRGHVWVLERGETPVGLFRIEGVGQRRIQVMDVCVHPKFRGQGLGTQVLEAAASIAKQDYARGCVLAAVMSEAGEKAARRVGFTSFGTIEDVHFA